MLTRYESTCGKFTFYEYVIQAVFEFRDRFNNRIHKA